MAPQRSSGARKGGMRAEQVGPIVFHAARTASLGLYLDGLPPALAARIRLLPPGRPQDDLAVLARAGLVVHVRGFEAAWRSGLDDALERLGVPRAWFTDDDLAALRGEQPGFGFYSEARLAGFAARMVALVGTTPALCRRLTAFHPRVLHWPCVLDEALLPGEVARPDGPLRIAAFGGAFRGDGFRRVGLPAIAAVPGCEAFVAAGLHPPAPRIRAIPFEPDFQAFLRLWRGLRPDIVLHPPGRSANLPAKGPGALLVALYLGAVPVVADEPAFAALGEAEGVERLPDDPAAWRAAVLRLADPALRAARLARLRAHCREAFAGSGAAYAVQGLLALARPGEAAFPSTALPGWRPRLSWRLEAGLRSLPARLGVRRR